MKAKRALPLILLVLLFPPVAPGALATDLFGCYQMAVKTDPVLARARALLDSARAERPLARSKLLPRASGEAEVSTRNVHIKGFLPYTIKDSFIHDSYSISLQQSVLNGPAWADLQAANQDIKAAEAALIAARQDLISRVVDAYFSVLKARADAQVARSNRKRLERIYDQAQMFLKSGAGDIVSVYEAKARLDAAQAQVISADNAVHIAYRELERLTHAPTGELNNLKKDIRCLLPEPDDMDAWVKAALNHQPLLAKAKSRLLASEHLVEKARRERWPKVDLYAARTFARGEMLPDTRTGEWIAGFRVTVPFFLGGEIGANVEKAMGISLAARHELQDVKDGISLAAREAFLNLRNSVPQVRAARQAVESAKISLDATQKGYKVGTRTVVDVLDRVTDYDNALRRYNLALYGHIRARVRLKQAAGLLSEKDVKSINTLLQTNNKGD